MNAGKWKEVPATAKRALLLLAAGWAFHYVFYFGFISESQSERVTYLQLGVGVGICFFAIKGKDWARRLCLFFNAIMTLMYMLFALAFAQGGKPGLVALNLWVSVLFGSSLYYLLKSDTRRFFSPPVSEISDGDQTEGRKEAGK